MQRVRGYKYRAYPDNEQKEFFEKTFGCCRFVYNYYLEAKQQVWKEWHDTLTYPEMSRDLSHVLKKEKPWLKEADSIALQQSLRHLERAYENFFRKRGGYPKFKRKLEYKMADHGGMLIKVPMMYPSSQRCSCCGKMNHKVRDLTVRSWRCPECGTEHDRDINAAVNILEKGLEMLASQAREDYS